VDYHVYLKLSLQGVGIVVAAYLIGFHLWMFLKPAASQAWLGGAHRNETAGMIAMAVGMIWFWLLVAPQGDGLLNFLAMDLGASPGGFNGLKPYLRFIVPLALFGLCVLCKEFLFVRGLGLTMLMAAAPILGSAFQKDPTSRLLIVVFAYALVVKGLFFVGMPYLFRDGITWAKASDSRWKSLAIAGMVYGVLVLICAVFMWGSAN